ncbi:MAG: PDZ domain-containing protein [Spirochaetia bacterium]|nr:PDZ domain-containing protein [Spirochaetia bacterium]
MHCFGGINARSQDSDIRTVLRNILTITVIAFTLGFGAYCKTPEKKTGPAYLGVLYQQTRHGVEIVQIMPNSPALSAGLAIGDTIVAVDGERVGRASSLRLAILARKPGASIVLTVLRASGDRENLTATVDNLPDPIR